MSAGQVTVVGQCPYVKLVGDSLTACGKRSGHFFGHKDGYGYTDGEWLHRDRFELVKVQYGARVVCEWRVKR